MDSFYYDYLELCTEVGKIDKEAEKYMLSLLGKKGFKPYWNLVKSFKWSDTPQGFEYWDTIDKKLRGVLK